MIVCDPKRRRSGSSLSHRRNVFVPVPIPPPRSAPTTYRRPRRNIGDIVYITSPTKVYLDFYDENLTNIRVDGCVDEEVKHCDEQPHVDIDKPVRNKSRGFVPKLKFKIIEGSAELQEINCFIGKHTVATR